MTIWAQRILCSPSLIPLQGIYVAIFLQCICILYEKDKGVDTASETGSDSTLQHVTSKEDRDNDVVSSLIWISLPSGAQGSANMNLNLHCDSYDYHQNLFLLALSFVSCNVGQEPIYGRCHIKRMDSTFCIDVLTRRNDWRTAIQNTLTKELQYKTVSPFWGWVWAWLPIF